MKRKTRKFFGILFCCIAISILMWASSYSLKIKEPIFSHESGFYNDEFYLTIDALDGYEIYYTLDGSIPNDDSEIYKKPILIAGITDEIPLKYANIERVSGFDVLGWDSYIPNGNVDRVNIVSARAKDSKGKWSQTVVNAYFVGIEQDEYNDLLVVELTVEPEDLFGENGIYINGEQYDELVSDYAMGKEEDAEKLIEAQVIWKMANWAKKGKEWKKDADLVFFKDNIVYKTKAQVNISGGLSRIFYQKAFSVTFEENVAFPILGGG